MHFSPYQDDINIMTSNINLNPSIQTQQAERIKWIDSLKGLLLLGITFAHFGYLPNYLNFIIISGSVFRVPCFLFLSGMLFSRRKYPTFRHYLKHKSKVLLLPYISMSVLFILLDWNTYLHPLSSIPQNLYAIFMGQGPAKASPLWFIITLYILNLIYYAIDKNLKTKSLKVIIMLILSGFGYILYLKDINLPFHIEIAFSTLVFLGLGHLFKDYTHLLINYIKDHTLLIIPSTIVLFCLSIITGMFNSQAALSKNIIGNYGLYYISAFSGIFGITLLIVYLKTRFNEVKPMQWVFKRLNYISIHALPILACQYYIIIVINNMLKLMFEEDFNHIVFFLKIITLVVIFYFFIIPLSYNKLYMFFGKQKQSWKNLLVIK